MISQTKHNEKKCQQYLSNNTPLQIIEGTASEKTGMIALGTFKWSICCRDNGAIEDKVSA